MQWATRHVVKARTVVLGGEVFSLSAHDSSDDVSSYIKIIYRVKSARCIGAKKDVVKAITLENCFLLASWRIHCD